MSRDMHIKERWAHHKSYIISLDINWNCAHKKKRDMERQKERRGKRRQSTRLKMLQILQQQQKKSQRKERKIQAIFVFGSRYETRT